MIRHLQVSNILWVIISWCKLKMHFCFLKGCLCRTWRKEKKLVSSIGKFDIK